MDILLRQHNFEDLYVPFQIADFGLSKWRQLSISKGSGSKPAEMGGTVIYMPPEEYEPNKTRRADVKQDMYRSASY